MDLIPLALIILAITFICMTISGIMIERVTTIKSSPKIIKDPPMDYKKPLKVVKPLKGPVGVAWYMEDGKVSPRKKTINVEKLEKKTGNFLNTKA